MFGRGRKDEESGLGSLSSGTGPPSGGAEPLTIGLPAGYSGSPSQPPPHRPSADGPSETPLLVVFMVLALLAVGGALVKLQNDDRGRAGTASSGGVSPASSSKLVTGGSSYLQPTRLASELRSLDRRVGGTARIVDLRLDGDTFHASYANADDNEATLTKTPSFTSRSTIPIAVTSVVPSNRIDPQVPLRLVAAVRERTGARPQDIDYVVFSATFAKLGSAWSVFLNRGPAARRHFVADLDGRDLRLPGEQTPTQRRRAQQRTACLQRARSGAQVARCLP